jgi:AraC family transcriptional regulator
LSRATRIKYAGGRTGHSGHVTADDTFADFVDLLAEALDERSATEEASGEQWAARLHFSRFHFDRMIRSVAGEPPQAFRRRILLERAAYRMVTTTAPLLDIAVEAGYGSHEAFTRAFSRAYGVAPGRWRKAPGRIRIEAPSNVHFHPPGSLRLPARDKVTAMELMTRMVEHHVWLTGEMIRVAGRLTDGQLDETIVLDVDDDQQTIRSLLSRLVGQMGMWNAAIATRDYDWSVEEHESLTSMRQRLAEEGPTFLSQVREVADTNRLDDTFIDALCEPAEVFTYGGMVAHVLTFAAHRRTLVVLALAKHGVEELGWGDPMVWVAQPR